MERKWWTLLAVCVATFMLLVDITIVNVALPAIQRDLHAGLTSLQWVVDAYALTLAATLLTAGSLADRLGRKRVFAVGVTVFSLASLACGLATTPTMLDLARAVQGFGGAAMFATGLALIAQEFRGPERGTAIAVWGSTVGIAVAIGPLAGGALTEGLSWSWIFFINVPIGVVALATRRLAQRAPARMMLGGGLALVSAGLLLMHGVTVHSAWTALLAGLIVAGAGIGLANPAIGSTALAVVEPERSGMASGINNTCRLGGVAIGIAALGAIFQHRIASDLAERLPHAPRGLAAAVASGGTQGLAHGHGAVLDAGRDAFVAGLNEILLVGAAIVLV